MEVCEALIGRPEVLGQIAGLGPKAAYGWRHGSAWRDAGDLHSARTMRLLLAHARDRGIPLTAEHLIWGAEAAEIEALLAPGKVAAE
jgi:hypothetical protein